MSKKQQVADPSGATILASVSSAELKAPPKATDNLSFIALSENQVKYECGHEGPEKFEMDFYGMRMKPKFPKEEKLRICPTCRVEEVKKVSIRCVLCRNIIFPSEPVALYAINEDMDLSIATKVKAGEVECVVGCLNMDCCPSGGFFAGHWSEQGLQPAHANGLTAAAEAFATGKVVISNT